MTTVANDSDAWIRRYRPAPQSRVRLVCFPHAGGSASFFVPVARALPDTVDVLAVQYPGRQDRRADPPIEVLTDLADEVYAAVRRWADRPLAFFGHSMGAVLAFEVASRLQRAGDDRVRLLFASGRRAPSRWRDERVYQRDDDGLVAELRSLRGTDQRVLEDDELLRMIMPAIRGDYTAVETYVWEPAAPLRCPVVAMVGDSDPKTTLDEARAWGDHTTGGFTLRVYPGGHFYLAAQQADVISEIRAELASRQLV
jgi:surfactin synthase thioesterase subunit